MKAGQLQAWGEGANGLKACWRVPLADWAPMYEGAPKMDMLMDGGGC